MAYDTIQGSWAETQSLFRPIPTNRLQSNLAFFYQRTSQFVEDQFQEMLASNGLEPKTKGKETQEASREENPRLRPKGIGHLIDILV